jgi:hypothetical protein
LKSFEKNFDSVSSVFDSSLGIVDCSFDNPFVHMLNAIPSPVLLIDGDLSIVAANSAAIKLSGDAPESILRKQSGDAFYCLQAKSNPKGCTHGNSCDSCLLQGAMKKALAGDKVQRARAKLEVVKQGKVQEFFALVTTNPLSINKKRYCLMIIEDISELVELQGILPICSYCKKIRHDDQAWEQMEGYLSKHLDVVFSHGICPDCLEIQMAELAELKKSKI